MVLISYKNIILVFKLNGAELKENGRAMLRAEITILQAKE